MARKPLSDWINLKTVSITATLVLLVDAVYLCSNYYGILNDYLPFLINNYAISFGWIYFLLNAVAVNVLDKVKKNKMKKYCPHCGDNLAISKYKCV